MISRRRSDHGPPDESESVLNSNLKAFGIAQVGDSLTWFDYVGRAVLRLFIEASEGRDESRSSEEHEYWAGRLSVCESILRDVADGGMRLRVRTFIDFAKSERIKSAMCSKRSPRMEVAMYHEGRRDAWVAVTDSASRAAKKLNRKNKRGGS